MGLKLSPFSVMMTIFWGFGGSILYLLATSIISYLWVGSAYTAKYIQYYSYYFNTLISFGLILGVAIYTFKSQTLITDVIEKTFTFESLSKTDYYHFRSLYQSRRNSIVFGVEFMLVAWIVFLLCQFPKTPPVEPFMTLAVSIEYALGVYVGRKLCYGGMMMHALKSIDVDRNIYKNHELDDVHTYSTVLSTLTIIFVYIHVDSYLSGPFLFDSFLAESAKILIAIPAIIALPVLLIFNFYPREVTKDIYQKSIDFELKELEESISHSGLRNHEKRSHLIEYEKTQKDSLKDHLKLTISDLPIGITIAIMVLSPLLSK